MAHPQFEIVVSQDGTEVLRQTLPPGEYVLGQEAGVELVLDLPQVAPRHARLTIEEDAIYVEDLGSEVGTFINGRSVKDNTRVWPSQEIRIGAATVEAHLLESAGAAPVDPATVPTEIVTERTYEIDKVLKREEEGPILDTHDSAIRRDLAMKVMTPGGSEEEVARFVEEAQITGQLEHPGIPPIHELGTDEQGNPYYTMKVVRGVTLGKVLELLAGKQPAALEKYPLRHLLAVLEKVCEAVAFAHSKGVIHRDLKPESINIGDFGEVLVMDWGSAKGLDGRSAAAAPATEPGVIVGTPAYIAPEQARGEVAALDARSDIYSLGAILYHLLALRAPLEVDDRAAALKLVGEGRTDHLDLGQRHPHLPHERIPDPLAAIVAKAMHLQPAARYQRVEELQADLAAYRHVTITAAEQVGPIRQFFFVVRRYKTVSLASAIVVGASLFFGITSVLTARHALQKSARDQAMATNLRSKAPELLKLAEYHADTQQFDEALTSLDAALAVEPKLTRPYWERAWILLALERWDDAVGALQAAQQHDPGGASPARVLPAVAKMKSLARDPQRWKNEAAQELFSYLDSAGAAGPAFAIATKLHENAEARRKLIDQRLLALLGRDHYTATAGRDGLVSINVAQQPLRSLDPLRGLPIDVLDASGTAITEVEALRGIRLQTLILSNTKVASLAPLTGVPLRRLIIDNTQVRDLAPVKGSPLEVLNIEGTKVYDITLVKGTPLRALNIKNTVITNLNVLQGLPLESLNIAGTAVTDLAPLQNAPLKELDLRNCKRIASFAPVLALPALERLSCDVLPKELAALRQSKTLQTIEADTYPGEGFQGARPAAAFWADYDTRKPPGTK